MNFTKSKDGALRADVKVTFRIGKDDLVAAVATEYSSGDFSLHDGKLVRHTPDVCTSRARIIGVLKKRLAESGDVRLHSWADGLTLEESKAVEVAASVTVTRHFPEL